jgi:hypothetical protein
MLSGSCEIPGEISADLQAYTIEPLECDTSNFEGQESVALFLWVFEETNEKRPAPSGVYWCSTVARFSLLIVAGLTC